MCCVCMYMCKDERTYYTELLHEGVCIVFCVNVCIGVCMYKYILCACGYMLCVYAYI